MKWSNGVQFLPPAAREAKLTGTAVREILDCPGVGFEVAGEDVDQCRFSGAVVATKQDDFALSEFEVHAIEHHLTAKGFS